MSVFYIYRDYINDLLLPGEKIANEIDDFHPVYLVDNEDQYKVYLYFNWNKNKFDYTRLYIQEEVDDEKKILGIQFPCCPLREDIAIRVCEILNSEWKKLTKRGVW